MKILVLFFISLFLFINPVCMAMPENHNWPDLVGVDVDEAEKRILADMPDAQIVRVPPAMMTRDYNPQRVFLVHKDGKVVLAPHNS